METANFPKIDAAGLESLAGGEDDEGTLIFGGRKKIETTLIGRPKPLVAPFSRTECVYYEVEAAFETPREDHHIGTAVSEADFFALIRDKLVTVGEVELDFPDTFKRTEKTATMTPQIIEGLKTLGWLDDARSHPAVTVHEKVLLSGKKYPLTVQKMTFPLPPSSAGTPPISETAYHFHFNKPSWGPRRVGFTASRSTKMGGLSGASLQDGDVSVVTEDDIVDAGNFSFQ